jgi:hypothetical protein
MDIFVTRHAIERYRQRLFDFKASDESISEILREIALKGKAISIRRDNSNNCLEKKYKGVSIVSIHNHKKNRRYYLPGGSCVSKLGKKQ